MWRSSAKSGGRGREVRLEEGRKTEDVAWLTLLVKDLVRVLARERDSARKGSDELDDLGDVVLGDGGTNREKSAALEREFTRLTHRRPWSTFRSPPQARRGGRRLRARRTERAREKSEGQLDAPRARKESRGLTKQAALQLSTVGVQGEPRMISGLRY